MFPSQAHTPHRIIAITPDHLSLAGDSNTALFLAQVLFWWQASGRKKFYKFNSPCSHKLYRAGDSWTEELHLKRTMFVTARRRVATKVRLSCKAEVQAAFDHGSIIVYGTDENHLTWYVVNEGALAVRSPHLYARLVGSEVKSSALTPRSTPRPKPVAPKRTARAVSSVKPLPNVPKSTTASLPDPDSQHSLMHSFDIGFNTETTPKTAPELISETSFQSSDTILKPPPTLTVRVGEGEGHKGTLSPTTKQVMEGLQQCGVQSGPARLIAQRALRAGWDVSKTLDTFEAHLVDATRAGVRSPVGVAVSRMLDGASIPSAPPWAERAVQEKKRQREIEQRQVEVVASEKDSPKEVATVCTADVEQAKPSSPLKTLWTQVLGDIKLQVTRATFEQRFRNTWLEGGGSAYMVRCRDPHTIDWLAHRLNHLVTTTLQRYSGCQVSVLFGASPN